jgi:RimJ/RimL family protein N-acetyltransferase
VHINWKDKNAEISFIIDPKLEKEYFQQHWTTYLALIEQVAFEGLDLRKIYTYAFDLRPHLYKAVEAAGFEKEAELKEHFLHNAEYKSVVIHSKINPIGIRPVTIDDLTLIFEWSNDELTRANSFQQEPILFDAHSDWFKARLKDKHKHSFICTFRDEPAAFLRLDQEDDHAIIGINIAPEFRGKGLSSGFLKKAHQTISHLIPKIKIRALIKNQNTPSIKSFERAGYRFISNTVVEGVKTLIYQL